jgi:hypothetical protein
MNAISWIKGLTSPSTLSFVQIARNGDVKYSTKRITPLGFYDTPIKILDATGDASAYSALIGRRLKRFGQTWIGTAIGFTLKRAFAEQICLNRRSLNLRNLLADMLSYTKHSGSWSSHTCAMRNRSWVF